MRFAFYLCIDKRSPGLAKLIIYVNRRESTNSCRTNKRGLVAYYTQRLNSKSSQEKICKFAFASLFALLHTFYRVKGSGSSSCDCIIIWKPIEQPKHWTELNQKQTSRLKTATYITKLQTDKYLLNNWLHAVYSEPQFLWVKCHLKIEWIKTIDSMNRNQWRKRN